MSNTREIATQILSNIYDKLEFFEISINNNKKYNRLDARDKAFVKLLIYNTLRRNGQIQRVINDFVKKPLMKKDYFILNLIRISICQILFLDIKEYSIVNTAVEIAKDYKFDKFVNGLLRNICRNKDDIIKSLKLELNIPSWISKDIKKSLGKIALTRISETVVKEPFLDIKIKSKYLKKENWPSLLEGKFIFKNMIRIKNEGQIEKKPFFYDGIWWIQSFSSSFPVQIIEDIYKKRSKADISVLDVGAAPGGKTFQLIEQEFNVTSIEISQKRLLRLNENLKRLNFKSKIIHDDYLNYRFTEYFDCILIDAPCTASGLIQKKPEILIKDKRLELKKLESKQQKMLKKSAKILKPGGYIVYCVCSILSKEGIDQINYFLKNNKNFELVSINNEIASFGRTLKKGVILITPDETEIKGGLDGFFISLIQKK